MSKAVAALAVLAAVSLGIVMYLRPARGKAPAEAFAERGQSQRLLPLWPAPDFAFVDQHGRTVSSASLRGKVWVANFIFTQCRTLCPMLTAKMVQLQRQLRGVDVTFVSFSVDPEHDTPPVLASYQRRWAEDETRWELLATTPPTLGALVRDFRVTAQPAPAGSVDPIIHSSVFLLIDEHGQVRGAFDSEQRADFEALAQGVRQLTNAGPPPALAPLEPAAQYHALGCSSCHEHPELAPPLHNLKGLKRELDNALTVTVDEPYLRESLVAPLAKRVKGYPLQMPSYEGLLTEPELESMVAWLLERRAVDGAGAPENALVAIDPVCHMSVRVAADTPSAPSPDGGQVQFCSSVCKARWLSMQGAVDAGL